VSAKPPLTTVRVNGTAVTPEPCIDFTGTGITATDDPVNKKTSITLSLPGSGTVTSIGIGSDLTSTQTPLTTSGTISVAATVARLAGTTPFSAQQTFSAGIVTDAINSVSSDALVLTSTRLDGAADGAVLASAPSVTDINNNILALKQTGGTRIWSFSGANSVAAALSAYGSGGSFIGGLIFSTTGLTHENGSMLDLGTTANIWQSVCSKSFYGAQQNATTSGAISITTNLGGTGRIAQSGIVTSLTLSNGRADQKFCLIIVGNGSAGVTTITGAKLAGGSFVWPGAGVKSVLQFVWDTSDLVWCQIGTTVQVS